MRQILYHRYCMTFCIAPPLSRRRRQHMVRHLQTPYMYSFRLAINIEEQKGRNLTVMSLCIFIINFNVFTHVMPRQGFLSPLLAGTVKCLSLPNSREIAPIRQHATLLRTPTLPPPSLVAMDSYCLEAPAGETASPDAKARPSLTFLLVKSGRWKVRRVSAQPFGVFRVSLTFCRHEKHTPQMHLSQSRCNQNKVRFRFRQKNGSESLSGVVVVGRGDGKLRLPSFGIDAL